MPVCVETRIVSSGTVRVMEGAPPDADCLARSLSEPRAFEPIFDRRADAARPPAIRPLAITVDAEAMLTEPEGPRALEGYEAAAVRHQRAVKTLRNSRQILFRSNFGIVRFERRGDVLHAIHEVYTAARLPEDVGTSELVPEVFMLQETPLAAPEQVRPEILSLQPLGAEETRVTTAQG